LRIARAVQWIGWDGDDVFRGRYEHTVDGKGRTSLPARFREQLAALGESKLVITTGLDPCLVAYTLREWEAFEQRLAALPSFDKSVATLKRIYVSGAVECDIDKLGRLLLQPSLRKHGGIEREVLWAGMGKHIELWDKARFEAANQATLDDEAARADVAARLAELGL
jgi:MraZ protein